MIASISKRRAGGPMYSHQVPCKKGKYQNKFVYANMFVPSCSVQANSIYLYSKVPVLNSDPFTSIGFET